MFKISHVIVYSEEGEDGGQEPKTVWGLYASHAEANQEMQAMFDSYMETELPADDIEPDESDDSDASHFYIKCGDREWHWHIVEFSGFPAMD